ncbi:MAG: molybdopterin cofactor-binding domain-containing protein, partial [Thermoanaerobaculia bacterium]|nr:molybdopterin cofactor-binding domain-containing protein [Thermoanaerobaculia bacterium]
MAEPIEKRPRKGDEPATGRAEPSERPRSLIGKPFRRVDGRAKVTGVTRFADDLAFPRMAFVRLVRSTVPHALIRSIDLSAAEQVPGYLGSLTGEAMPETFGILPVSQDEHALAVGKVRMVGDPVVAIAATSEDAAAEAALAVEIDYEPLPTISSLEEALATDEFRIHDYSPEGGNVHKAVSMEFGAVDEALERADIVLEDTFFYQGNTHLPMEQHAAVAVPEDEGRVTLYSSTQTPHYVHRALARVLKLPASRIRVIACPNGGGFGGKSDPFNHEIVAAKMALVLGRPVKITLSREEVFYCHRGRHPVLMQMRTGFTSDGRITGQHLKTALDGGSYGSYGVASTYYTGALQTVTYDLPHYRFDGVRVFTNKPPCGPKRGHGTPQPRFGWEVHLDKAAHRLGIDPAEIRLRNLAPPESVTANWLKIGSMGLGACIEAVVEGSGWRERYGRLPEGRGLGLACGSYLCGAGLPIYWNHMPQSGVQLQLDRSGRVAVFCGQAEIGQGSDSVLASIVAEILGIELDDIRLCVADTDLTPVDLGSYSSRVTLMVGNAAIEAAERARDLVARAVAERLEISKSRLVFAERRVFDGENPDDGMSFPEAVIVAESRFGTLGTVGSYIPPRSPGKYRGSGVGPSPAYSYTAAVVEVEVDTATGLYRPLHVWIAHDIGKSINPVLVLGQVEGSVYMALGEAMMEEMEYRRLPKHMSSALVHKMPSMLEYKSPTFHDMPPVTTYLIEDPDPEGPYGAKEVGQGPLLPVLPARAHPGTGLATGLAAMVRRAAGYRTGVQRREFSLPCTYCRTLSAVAESHPLGGGFGTSGSDLARLRLGVRSGSGSG